MFPDHPENPADDWQLEPSGRPVAAVAPPDLNPGRSGVGLAGAAALSLLLYAGVAFLLIRPALK